MKLQNCGLEKENMKSFLRIYLFICLRVYLDPIGPIGELEIYSQLLDLRSFDCRFNLCVVIVWNFSASVGEHFTFQSRVPDVVVEQWMIHVVCAPDTVSGVTCELANQTNQALIDIELGE